MSMEDRSGGPCLRSGFTTGACAAAASKAALMRLLRPDLEIRLVSIPFPDGSRHEFSLFSLSSSGASVRASIIKDAGDDPDVTNGAEIGAGVRVLARPEGLQGENGFPAIRFMAGPGVGTVTREGLAPAAGGPAINPGPKKMIRAAVREAIEETGEKTEKVGHEAGRRSFESSLIEITISIKDGEKLAENTLNPRLGIVGGLSVLGTTGIVKPVSAKAWTDTIDVCLNVAEKAGLEEVIISTGRTSERAVQELLGLPDEALVMMGDYLEYAMKAAGGRGFKRLHLAGMWAKIIKAALEIPQTHVRHGALDTGQAAGLLMELGLPRRLEKNVRSANTARHILEMLLRHGREDLLKTTCRRAGRYARRLSGIPVTVHLVTPARKVISAQ